MPCYVNTKSTLRGKRWLREDGVNADRQSLPKEVNSFYKEVLGVPSFILVFHYHGKLIHSLLF